MKMKIPIDQKFENNLKDSGSGRYSQKISSGIGAYATQRKPAISVSGSENKNPIRFVRIL